VEHNKVVFVQSVKIYCQFLFIIQRHALLMYHKFDYKLQKSTLITFTM